MSEFGTQQEKIDWHRAVAHEREMWTQIAEAHIAGRVKLKKFLTRRYLHSFDARLVAARTAYKKMKPNQRPPLSSLSSVARTANAWEGTAEHVWVKLKPKKSNPDELRVIMAFGLENRALQHLVWRCLAAQADLHAAQFTLKGGCKKAVEHVKNAVMAGNGHCVQWDIKNCFGSFNGESLANILPLPKEVIDRVIRPKYFTLTDNSMFVYQPGNSLDEDGEFFAEARQGIAQGSAVSSLVAEIALANAIEEVSKLGVVVAYADNLLLISATKGQMVSMNNALCTLMNAHPAGPLWLNQPIKYAPGEAVEFLGYRIAGGKIEPSQDNLLRFEEKFEMGISRVEQGDMSPKVRQERIKKLRHYVSSWAGAFSLWESAKEHRNKYLDMLSAASAV